MDEQRSEAWFKERIGKATASRFSDVMAKGRNGQSLASRKNYLAELVIERLTGEAKDSITSAPIEWGIENEPVALLAYELETGNQVGNAFFEKHPTLEAGASPDGYVGDDGLIEIKCPNSATHLETLKTKEIPKQYYAQVQGQLWITGRKWCDFVSYDPRYPANAQIFITRIERDNDYIEELEEEMIEFLAEVTAETNYVKEYTK